MTKKEETKGLLEVVFIMDRSGSMSGKEEDTIGGFNAMLEKQKDLDNVIWSTVLFDHEREVIHDRLPIQQVEPLTEKEYYVRGSTALLDAVGKAIDHFTKCHEYAKAADRPTKTLLIINTDGLENASEHYTGAMVKEMIESKQKQGWEFIYLGEELDAVCEADHIGIRSSRAARYKGDKASRDLCYDVIGDSVRRMAFEDFLMDDCLMPLKEDAE